MSWQGHIETEIDNLIDMVADGYASAPSREEVADYALEVMMRQRCGEVEVHLETPKGCQEAAALIKSTETCRAQRWVGLPDRWPANDGSSARDLRAGAAVNFAAARWLERKAAE